MSSETPITQWHVPVDDTRCYWYAIFTSFGKPVDRDEMRRQRLEQAQCLQRIAGLEIHLGEPVTLGFLHSDLLRR